MRRERCIWSGNSRKECEWVLESQARVEKGRRGYNYTKVLSRAVVTLTGHRDRVLYSEGSDCGSWKSRISGADKIA